MIRLMQWLVFGHCHKWKTIDQNSLVASANRRGTRFYQQCECCGKVVKRDLI